MAVPLYRIFGTPAKASSPIVVTPLGIVRDVSPEQSAKAWNPILVTLLGIVIAVSPEQLEKAYSPILVTLLGMVVFLHPAMSVLVAFSKIALQLSRLS